MYDMSIQLNWDINLQLCLCGRAGHLNRGWRWINYIEKTIKFSVSNQNNITRCWLYLCAATVLYNVLPSPIHDVKCFSWNTHHIMSFIHPVCQRCMIQNIKAVLCTNYTQIPEKVGMLCKLSINNMKQLYISCLLKTLLQSVPEPMQQYPSYNHAFHKVL